MVEKVELYEIMVEPESSRSWKGLFNFKPNADQVEDAMMADIRELDLEVEHELDLANAWRKTLELVTFQQPELLGEVHIAGTMVGEISIAIIQSFGMVEEAMMPLPTLRSDLVNRQVAETRRSRLDEFDGILTDPRTGVPLVYPLPAIHTDPPNLSTSQRQNIVSDQSARNEL
jgi:hypothetical protein